MKKSIVGQNKLAVVIPYYKIDFFTETLQSLAGQSNKNFKVYIGNDASPDNPLRTISNFLDEFEIEYFQFEENLGGICLSEQWHRCLEKVQQEEWVMILGDDDVLDSNCVSEFYSNLKAVNENHIKVVRYARRVIDSLNRPVSKVQRHPVIENSASFFFRKLKGDVSSSLSEYIFKAATVKEIKFRNFPLAWHSDDCALLEFSDFGNIYSINSAVAFIRSSGVNISGRKDLNKLKNKGSFYFYHYLLRNYHQQFSSDEKEILYRRYEKRLLDDKKDFSLFLKLSFTYLRKVRLYNYLRFLKKFSLSIRYASRSKSGKV